MNVNELIAALGTEFYTGVPDSKLRPLEDYLMDTYGASSPAHIIAANEGNAAALSATLSTRCSRCCTRRSTASHASSLSVGAASRICMTSRSISCRGG